MLDVGIRLHDYYTVIKNKTIIFYNKENKKKLKVNVDNPELLIILEDSNYANYAKEEILLHIHNNKLFFSFSKPLESKTKKGFYEIPYYPGYLINRNGILWNKKKSIYHKYTASKGKENDNNRKRGYFLCRAKSPFKNGSHSSRHRLLSLAFKKYENDPMELIVNHINGVPGDDRLNNIEWTTYSGNLKHALNNGLMPNSIIPIKVFNVKTEKITFYKSIASAGRLLNKHVSFIQHRLKNKNVVYSDNILFYKVSDNINKSKIKRGTEPVKLEVTNNITKETNIFNSVEEASRILNINPTSIRDRYKTMSNKPIKGYIIKFLCFKYSCPDDK